MIQNSHSPVVSWLREEAAANAQLTTDSRAVAPGDVFFAYPGAVNDGRQFIENAIQRGSKAILWDSAPPFEWSSHWVVAQRAVPRLKWLAGPIAAEWYGAPSEHMACVGVTGTSGKSSCALWLAHAAESLGRRAGYVGTLGAGRLGALEEFGNTTPDPARLQRLMAHLLRERVEVMAMEVSSIGIEEGRVDGMHFRVALFCNLSRDHLDYHGSMARYEAAKSRLFAWPGLRCAVVNFDDPAGQRIARVAALAGATVLGYGIHSPAPLFCRASSIVYGASGMSFDITGDFGVRHFTTALIGTYNVSNLLGVLAVLTALGHDVDASLAAMAQLRPVPGRLEVIPSARGPMVIVDYAHKPDALEKALHACRPLAQARGGRLYLVFGCGGDRDPGKRPIMGEIASRLADRVLVTDDNPRSERAEDIRHAIVAAGLAGGAAMKVIPDRAEAIRYAIGEAEEADIVLIAGKGHENYQEIQGEKLPFSDSSQARAALQSSHGAEPC